MVYLDPTTNFVLVGTPRVLTIADCRLNLGMRY